MAWKIQIMIGLDLYICLLPLQPFDVQVVMYAERNSSKEWTKNKQQKQQKTLQQVQKVLS